MKEKRMSEHASNYGKRDIKGKEGETEREHGVEKCK